MWTGIGLIGAAVLAVIILVVLLFVAPKESTDQAASGSLQAGGLNRVALGETSGGLAGSRPSEPVPDGGHALGANNLSLRDRLIQAGLYHTYFPAVFTAVRIGLAAAPVVVGLVAGSFGICRMTFGLSIGALLSLAGTLGPSFMLDYLKARRQTKIRRSLPDALDVIVVCLEGGLSLSGAFARVGQELGFAHPLLALELRIVEREVLLGRSTGEALRAFANRFDLEELRSLAAVVSQAERFGSSVVRALTVYADTMRSRRQQRAETMAHKAAIKVMFPTVLCILPALFIVLLGPAGYRIFQVMSTVQIKAQK